MKKTVLFLILTAVISTPFWWLWRTNGYFLYMVLLMWSPGIAAVMTARLTDTPLSALGLRPARIKPLLQSWAVVLAYCLGGLLIVVAVGAAAFPNTEKLTELGGKLGMPGASTVQVLVIYSALVWTAGPLLYIFSSLGEEIGWRGFWTPLAVEKFGFTGGTLLVGATWALWHWPLMVGNTPWLGIACFCVGVIGITFAYSWFRLRTGSLWPAVVKHALHNAFLAYVGAVLVLPEGGAPMAVWTGETGLAFAIMGVAVAIVFWLLARPRRAQD